MKAIISGDCIELSFLQFIGVVGLVNGALDKIYGGFEKVPQNDLERIRCIIHSFSDGRIDVDIGIF